jgi:hypothetical protein
MGFGDAMATRLRILAKKGADVDKATRDVMREAMSAAVEAAAETTPANELRGTGTVSGELKGAWATDSVIEPELTTDGYKCLLANNTGYASYVNNGHRMDRHFVPGLMVNEYSGLLERVPPDMGGIMVGTKTDYVPGVYMTDKAREVYEAVIISELSRKCREACKT